MKSPQESNTRRAAVDHQRLVRLGLERALVIRQPHIGLILDGMKTWEMRSAPTKIRGRIGLIEAGSGLIVGECEIDRMQAAPKSYRARYMTRAYHRIPEERFGVMDKWCWAWVLSNVLRYEEPVAYEHPQGAVIWVSLPNVNVDTPAQAGCVPRLVRLWRFLCEDTFGSSKTSFVWVRQKREFVPFIG